MSLVYYVYYSDASNYVAMSDGALSMPFGTTDASEPSVGSNVPAW